MLSRALLVMLLGILFPVFVFAQQVVVSEYFNSGDPRDEWVELLVIEDNVDLRNFTLRDNNSATNSWQDEITFTNISFWNNLRKGTVIIVWNRLYPSSSPTTARTLELQKEDGYIELSAQSTTYFSISGSVGSTFGSSPSWSGSALNISGTGDLLQIRNGSGTHVHALGHRSSMGSSWTGISGTNKLAYQGSLPTDSSLVICPGADLSDYVGGTHGSTKVDQTGIESYGLPNKCSSSTTSNANYWNQLRQPDYPTPVLNDVVANSTFDTFNLAWNSCTDPNPADGTVGYVILRNTIDAFTAPEDGTTYTTGATIASATVIATIASSSTTSYTDVMNLSCGDTLYYKVYAFRYGTDNLNGNSFNASRGRAYNETGTNTSFIIKSGGLSANNITAY